MTNNLKNLKKKSQVFIGRQPILDEKQEIFAYELLFRDGETGVANFESNLKATASVLKNTINYFRISELTKNRRAFINIDESILFSDFIEMIPPDKFVLEILEFVKVTPKVVSRVKALKESGYIFAIDDFDFSDEMFNEFKHLYQYASFIKADLFTIEDDSKIVPMKENITRINPKIKFLAEKVETEEEYLEFKAMGFKYFQGYFFQKPEVLKKEQVEPSFVAILETMDLLSKDAEPRKIEKVLKKYPDLTIHLLQYLNSPYIKLNNEIKSVLQAISLLGKTGMIRWVSLFFYSRVPENEGVDILLETALYRAMFFEKLCYNQSDLAYITGMFSMLEPIFCVKINDIIDELENIPLVIKEALTHRCGQLGDMITLVEAIQDGDDEFVTQYAKEYNISKKSIYKDSEEVMIEATKIKENLNQEKV
jgi:c-di-GMP phosphodiesterase